jgi:hypothetical protein
VTVESDDSPIEGLGHFFDTIWGSTEGFVYLPTRDQKSDTWVKRFFPWPKGKANVINHVLASTALGLDSYFAPAIFETATRPVKENIKGTNVLWAEFDGTAPEKWEPEPTDGSQRPPVPPPSLRIQSSRDGHEHVYWRLDEFTKDIEFVEGSNRSIAYTLRADTSGWDINQILRPPFTTNYKHDLPVTLVTNDSTDYNRSSFSQLKPALKLVSDSINTDDLPKVEWLIAKYRWDEEHFKLFMDTGVQLEADKRRSHALMRLGYYCAEQGMSDTEAYSIISNAADRWGKFTGRMDRKKRLIDIVNRARQKHPVALDSLTFKGLLEDTEVATGTQYLYGFQSFLDSEINIEWAVEGFIEKGGMGMISSAPGVGKTQLSIQFGIACALGIPFLGWKIPVPLKIFFFSLEMSHVALKIFMEQIALEYPDPVQRKLLEENFKIIPLGQSLPVDRPDSRQFMELMVNEHRPDGLIFDALGKLTSSELKEETAKKINDYMGVLRSKYGCFVWQIHHNKKAQEGNKKPNKLEDVYGNVYVTTDMTTVLTLWKGDSGIELNQVKARLTAESPMKKIIRGPHLNFVESTDAMLKNLVDKGEDNGDSSIAGFVPNM